MLNKTAIQSLVASAVLGIGLTFFAGQVAAGVKDPPTCDPKKEKCEPQCDPAKEICICHNIGGPDIGGPAVTVPGAVTVGANCDGTTDCQAYLATLTDQTHLINFNGAVASCIANPPITALGTADCDEGYLGIVVPHSIQAIIPHLLHGDGAALLVLDRLHLTQPHGSANFDCIGFRVLPQVNNDEPGN